MFLQFVPVMFALTGQAAPPPVTPPTAPTSVVRPAIVQTAPAQSPRPTPRQYDETATAQSVIAKAVTAANTDDIRALILWGANDNPRVQAFDVARRTAGGTFFSDEYMVGFVDVGKADKNVDVAKSYGVTLSADALPFLTVLDQKGKLVASISSRELAAAEGTGFDNKKVAAFLAKHQAPAPDAIKPFDAAVVQAKNEGKTLFLWYSAPWCGWCHRLGAWMAQPDVAPVLAKEFVILKLDFDRGIGAKEIQKRYIAEEQGLPWFVFLDGAGKALITSTREKGGNVGHPNAPDEVAHFKVMLQNVQKHLTTAEIDKLIESLVAANKAHG